MKSWISALLSQTKAVGSSCMMLSCQIRAWSQAEPSPPASSVCSHSDAMAGAQCESCVNWNKTPHRTKVKNGGIDKGESSPKMFRGGYSSKRISFAHRAFPNTQQLHPEKTLLPLYVVLLAQGELVFHGIRSEQCILELPFLNIKNNLGLYPKK